MKKFTYLLTLTTLLFLSSCGKDDGDSVELGLSGNITFDGTSTAISDGLIIDFGVLGGDYNYDFYLADGAIELSGINFDVDGSILIYLELYNEDSDSFQTGTFTVNATTGNYCETASVSTSDGEEFATGGTVTVSGSGQSFTIQLNLEFSDDRTLTGTVEGGFEIEEGFNLQ